MEMAGYGVFGTPSVVVNDEVNFFGKTPTKQEVMNWNGAGVCFRKIAGSTIGLLGLYFIVTPFL